MKSSPEGMDVSMKTSAIVLEMLTVLCTDVVISTVTLAGRDPRVPGTLEAGISESSAKHVQLVSAKL